MIDDKVVEDVRQGGRKWVIVKLLRKHMTELVGIFLDLDCKGFGGRWRKQIKGCLSSAFFLVIGNRKPRSGLDAF